MKKEKRFQVLSAQDGFATSYRVIVDCQTGVNYLLIGSGNGAGVTPLLNADGTVVVSTRDELDELQYK